MVVEGDRVRIVKWAYGPNDSHDDNLSVPPGTEGTVKFVFGGDNRQIGVIWDNGSNLLLLEGLDQYQVIQDEEEQ